MTLTRKRKWFWTVLFIFVVVLIASLATGWNVVIVRDYQRLADVARAFRLNNHFVGGELPGSTNALWINLVLGTLGFAVTLGGLVLFFVRLLQEMRLNQLQTEFLASVSHALKTPIATMELSSSLIRSGGLARDESEKLWESFDTDLLRLKEEVNTLLEATRWQTSPIRIHKTPIHLEEWIQDSMNRWKKILGPDARLERKGETFPFEIPMDAKVLNLIVDNFFDNARKFAREAPHVVIETEYVDGKGFWKKPNWKFKVKDNGWGFDSKEAKKLFHRFYRSRSEAPYAIPGTGLGLYLAWTAGKALNLKLSAESEGYGCGATFQIEGSTP